MPDRDDWKPVSVIADRPATKGTMEVLTRNLTDAARIASRRQASGVASVLDFGGPSGSAIPGILATNSPVAAFLYTISRADKLSLFRYWARHDCMVGRAIELHSELPMSRVTIGPPKGPSPRQNRQITRIYETMSERIDILGLMLEVSREYWMCFHPSNHVRIQGGGTRKIGDVIVGDMVLSKTGEYYPVKAVHEREVDEDIFVIDARGLTNPLKTTGDHVLFTVNGEKKAKDIQVGDELFFQPPTEEIPQLDITDEHCFLAGWFLAEGSFKSKDEIVFSLNPEKEFDAEAIPKIMLYLESLFEPEECYKSDIVSWNGEVREKRRQTPSSVNYSGGCFNCGAPHEWLIRAGVSSDGRERVKCTFCETRFTAGGSRGVKIPRINNTVCDNCIQIVYSNKKAYDFFKKECGEYAFYKKLDDRWMTLPRMQQRIVVKTWMHGDGAALEYGGFRGVTTSYTLFSQMYLILARLGINSYPSGCLEGKTVDLDQIREMDLQNRAAGIYNNKVLFMYTLLVAKREWIERIEEGIHEVDQLFLGLQKEWSLIAEEVIVATEIKHENLEFVRAVIKRYPVEGWKGLARDFGYSQGTISRTALKCGIRGSKHQFWTREKLDFLEKKYSICGPVLLARLWGTTAVAVNIMANRRGLYKETMLCESLVRWSNPTLSGAIPLEVISVNKEHYIGKVRDLSIDGDPSYVVENACVHNCGDVYLWCNWSNKLQMWDDVYALPVEFCHSLMHPFNRKKEIIFFAKPLVDTAAVRRITDRDMYMVADTDIEKLYEALGDTIPPELKEALNYGEAVPLNTNWRRGSYCIHVARNRAPNEEYGESIIERCMDTLLRLENLKNSNLQISSRNMNPKHIVTAPGTGKPQMDDLRAQIDLSMLEQVDYPIVTNFEVNWQTVGANERLLNTENEYNLLRQDLALGLGSTVEMLTGQSSYSGNRITLEMMNTTYLTFRDKMRKLVEEDIFRPVADALGHYQKEFIDVWPRVEPEEIEEGDILSEEEDGQLRRKRTLVNVLWNHSTLRFNRISIRDNAEVYDQLFQLYQKGSLAVRYLLDLHNIDPEENARAILEDIGGPKDPVFNDFVRAVYTSTDMPQKILNDTDFMARVIEGLHLTYKTPAAPAAGGGGGMGGGGMGGGGGLSDMGGVGGLGGGGDEGFGGPMGMPGEGMEGLPGAEGAPGGAAGVPGGPGGAPGAPPEAAPAPAASRRSGRREVDDNGSQLILPGRILTQEISTVAGRAIRAKSEEVEKTEGRSLEPEEVKAIIHAVEVEARRRKSSVNGKRSRNGTH